MIEVKHERTLIYTMYMQSGHFCMCYKKCVREKMFHSNEMIIKTKKQKLNHSKKRKYGFQNPFP